MLGTGEPDADAGAAVVGAGDWSDFLEHIQVYALSSQKRRAHICGLLTKWGFRGERVVPAISKDAVDLDEWAARGRVTRNACVTAQRAASHFGHRRVLRDFVEAAPSGKTVAVVFEDDLADQPAADVQSATLRFFKTAPDDFDILYLGLLHEAAGRHAYAVTRRGASVLLRETFPQDSAGDEMYWRAIRRSGLHAYEPARPIFKQDRAKFPAEQMDGGKLAPGSELRLECEDARPPARSTPGSCREPGQQSSGPTSEEGEVALSRDYAVVGNWNDWEYPPVDFARASPRHPVNVAVVPVPGGQQVEFQIVCRDRWEQRFYPAVDGEAIVGPSDNGHGQNWWTRAPESPALLHIRWNPLGHRQVDWHFTDARPLPGGTDSTNPDKLAAPPPPEVEEEQARFTRHEDCAAHGPDLLVATMTVEEAKIRCTTLPGCTCFSLEGRAGGGDSEAVMHFKSHRNLIISEGATSYCLQTSQSPQTAKHILIRGALGPHAEHICGTYALLDGGQCDGRSPVFCKNSGPEQLRLTEGGKWCVAHADTASEEAGAEHWAVSEAEAPGAPPTGISCWRVAADITQGSEGGWEEQALHVTDVTGQVSGQLSTGVHRFLEPLAAVAPSWARRWDLGGLFIDRAAAAAPLALRLALSAYPAEPPGNPIQDLWDPPGVSQPAAARACGTYYAVQPRGWPAGGDVELPSAVSSVVLRGTAAERLYVKPGDAHTPALLLSCGYLATTRRGRTSTKRWRVLEPSGEWVLEAKALSGPWVARTSLSEETDYRFCVVPGEDPPPEPVKVPGWPLNYSGQIRCHVVGIPGCRDDNVRALAASLGRALRMDSEYFSVDVYSYCAWDTRAFNEATVLELMDREVVRDGIDWRLATRILGCALSHSELWARRVESTDEHPWVVLEDDVVLNEARNVARLLPEALSGLREGGGDLMLLGAMSDATADGDNSSYAPPCFVRVRAFMGTWGYAVSRHGAARALRAVWGCAGTRCGEDRWGRGGLGVGVDAQLSAASEAGRLDVAMCVPHVVLHPGLRQGMRQRFKPVSYSWFVRDSHQSKSIRHNLDTEGDDGRPNMELVRKIESLTRKFRLLART